MENPCNNTQLLTCWSLQVSGRVPCPAPKKYRDECGIDLWTQVKSNLVISTASPKIPGNFETNKNKWFLTKGPEQNAIDSYESLTNFWIAFPNISCFSHPKFPTSDLSSSKNSSESGFFLIQNPIKNPWWLLDRKNFNGFSGYMLFTHLTPKTWQKPKTSWKYIPYDYCLLSPINR